MFCSGVFLAPYFIYLFHNLQSIFEIVNLFMGKQIPINLSLDSILFTFI